MIPTDAELHAARVELARLDPLMAKAHAEMRPSTWVVRERGFGGLVHQIAGQQVSVAAADATRRRTRAYSESVLTAGNQRLRNFGLSTQKVRYIRAGDEVRHSADGEAKTSTPQCRRIMAAAASNCAALVG